jgi:hypothetical protein
MTEMNLIISGLCLQLYEKASVAGLFISINADRVYVTPAA